MGAEKTIKILQVGNRSVCFWIGVVVLLTGVAFSNVVRVARRTGRSWYVAVQGDDSALGSKSHPWATIAKAALVAEAGDTVWIEPGTYYPTDLIRPAHSGTPEAPIVFRALEGGPVVIDAKGQVPSYDWDGVFMIDKKSWIVVDGRLAGLGWGCLAPRRLNLQVLLRAAATGGGFPLGRENERGIGCEVLPLRGTVRGDDRGF